MRGNDLDFPRNNFAGVPLDSFNVIPAKAGGKRPEGDSDPATMGWSKSEKGFVAEYCIEP